MIVHKVSNMKHDWNEITKPSRDWVWEPWTPSHVPFVQRSQKHTYTLSCSLRPALSKTYIHPLMFPSSSALKNIKTKGTWEGVCMFLRALDEGNMRGCFNVFESAGRREHERVYVCFSQNGRCIVGLTCAQLVAELHVPVHHGQSHEVFNLHLLTPAEEHQAVRVQGLQLQLHPQVVVDVGEGRIGDEGVLTVKMGRGHQSACCKNGQEHEIV